jgi:hypothetical protein
MKEIGNSRATQLRASILGFSTGAGLLVLGSAHFLHERQQESTESTMHGVTSAVGFRLSTIDASELARHAGENTISYADRTNTIVHNATFHCLPTQFSLSWAEILFSKVLGEKRFAWSEGPFGNELVCGFCHQRAITLAMILRDNGIHDAWAFGLNGHVAVKFADAGTDYLVDPDFGVSPYPLLTDKPALENIVREKYSGYNNIEDLVKIISSLDDDEAYGSPEWAKNIRDARDFLFLVADLNAGAVTTLGASFLFLSGFVVSRRPRCGASTGCPG